MIQKKICMVGTFGVGKTSLVARYVKTIFEETYFTTVGLKVDKKDLVVDGEEVKLMLWDLAGEDQTSQIKPMQLRGAAGYILVADGTRVSTLEVLTDIQARVQAVLGDVPFTCVINKLDLRETWQVDDAAIERFSALGWKLQLSSAKTGEGVEDLFVNLLDRMLQAKDSNA